MLLNELQKQYRLDQEQAQTIATDKSELQVQRQQIKAQQQQIAVQQKEIEGLRSQLQLQNGALQERLLRIDRSVGNQMQTIAQK